MAVPPPSPAPTVLATGHTAAGASTFVRAPAPRRLSPNIHLVYRVDGAGLINLDDDGDLDAIARLPLHCAAMIPGRGAVMLVVEIPPGEDRSKQMNRSQSVDVSVVVEGCVQCHLDSGESRILNRGDLILHRGTKHAWANPSPTETARMVCFVMPSFPIHSVSD